MTLTAPGAIPPRPRQKGSNYLDLLWTRAALVQTTTGTFELSTPVGVKCNAHHLASPVHACSNRGRATCAHGSRGFVLGEEVAATESGTRAEPPPKEGLNERGVPGRQS